MSDGRHATPRSHRGRAFSNRWIGHGRTRALLSLGILLGFGAVSTMAYWTDQATMTGGPISAGTLDLRLKDAGTLIGQGGTWPNTGFTAAGLIPGESVAFSFPVRNDGSAGFRLTATATASGDLAPGLRFTTTHGASPAVMTGTEAGGNRVGTCGSNTASGPTILSDTPASVIPTPGVTIGSGNLTTVCVIVKLDTSADNALQGKSGAATFVFDAQQLQP